MTDTNLAQLPEDQNPPKKTYGPRRKTRQAVTALLSRVGTAAKTYEECFVLKDEVFRAVRFEFPRDEDAARREFNALFSRHTDTYFVEGDKCALKSALRKIRENSPLATA